MAERERSALYPGATWDDCMEFIRKIGSLNLKAVSYQELAKQYGLSNPTTKSFTAKIGAAKQFGLITTAQGNTIQLTDASKRLLAVVTEYDVGIIRVRVVCQSVANHFETCYRAALHIDVVECSLPAR